MKERPVLSCVELPSRRAVEVEQWTTEMVRGAVQAEQLTVAVGVVAAKAAALNTLLPATNDEEPGRGSPRPRPASGAKRGARAAGPLAWEATPLPAPPLRGGQCGWPGPEGGGHHTHGQRLSGWAELAGRLPGEF